MLTAIFRATSWANCSRFDEDRRLTKTKTLLFTNKMRGRFSPLFQSTWYHVASPMTSSEFDSDLKCNPGPAVPPIQTASSRAACEESNNQYWTVRFSRHRCLTCTITDDSRIPGPVDSDTPRIMGRSYGVRVMGSSFTTTLFAQPVMQTIRKLTIKGTKILNISTNAFYFTITIFGRRELRFPTDLK